MRPFLLTAPALALLGACAQVQSYGQVAAEQRRQMNDIDGDRFGRERRALNRP